MWANRKYPRTAVHHGVDRGGHQPGFAEVADVELDVRSLDPDQWVQPVGLAPGEPSAQLVGVQVWVPAVPGQERDRRQLGRGHGGWLERQQRRRVLRVGHGRLRGEAGVARRTRRGRHDTRTRFRSAPRPGSIASWQTNRCSRSAASTRARD